MKEQEVEITIDKEKHVVKIQEYETFEELLTEVSAEDILSCFNIRNMQLQKQEQKKLLKPRRITLKEKRAHAFNMITEDELSEMKGDNKKFETRIIENLILVEEKIKAKEII